MNTRSLLCFSALCSFSLLIGCQNNAYTAESQTNFRQFHKGDHWEYEIGNDKMLYEITAETPKDSNGTRTLTVQITTTFAEGRRTSLNYLKGSKNTTTTLQQAANGSLMWARLPGDILPTLVHQWPNVVMCPFQKGKKYDTGEQPIANGTAQAITEVIGQTEIVVPQGRFLAWQVKTTRTLRAKRILEGAVITTVNDWYMSDRGLVKRESHTEAAVGIEKNPITSSFLLGIDVGATTVIQQVSGTSK
jgi:hypothetical protein